MINYSKREYSLNNRFIISAIKNLTSLGYTLKEIAQICEISISTLYRHIKKHDEIRLAIYTGRISSLVTVSRVAFSLATDGKHSSMTIWWLSQFDRWNLRSNDESDWPISNEKFTDFDEEFLSTLSNHELKVLESILARYEYFKNLHQTVSS